MQRMNIFKAASSYLKISGSGPKCALAICTKSYVLNVGIHIRVSVYACTGIHVWYSTCRPMCICTGRQSFSAGRHSLMVNEGTRVHAKQTQTFKDLTANSMSSVQYKLGLDLKDDLRKPKRKNSKKMTAFAIAGGCLSLKKRRKSDQHQGENDALLTSENLDDPSAPESSTLPRMQDENRDLSTENSTERIENDDQMKPFDLEFKEMEENAARAAALPQTNDSTVKCCSVEEMNLFISDNLSKTDVDDTVNQDCNSSDNRNKVGTSSEPLITQGGETVREAAVDSKIVSESAQEEGVYNLHFLFDEKRSGKKRKRTSTEVENAKKKMDSPNCFVGIQISDKTVQRNLQDVQDAIIEGEKRLKPALITLTTLHLTLLVMRVEDEELERASQVLRNSHEEVAKDFTQNPVQLEFEGLSDFKRQVLFAKVKPSAALERVQKLADLVTDNFRNAGIPLPGFKEFKPHATIMKLSKAPKLRHKGIREIKKNLYKDFVDNYFGSQYVNSLQLLSMTKPRTEDGYYHCEKEFIFDIPEGLCSCIDSQLNRTELLREEVSSSKEKVKRKISDLTRAQLESTEKK